MASQLRSLLFLLTALPLLLAALAFWLQWWGPGPSRELDAPNCHNRLLPSGDAKMGWQGRLEGFPKPSDPKISVITTTSAGLDQSLPWLLYHRVMGVAQFIVFVEGEAATDYSRAVLGNIPGVQLVRRSQELEEQQKKSRIWKEKWLAAFFHRPCNYELFVRQNLNMEMAIVMAREAGMEWIIHLDTDELLHPAGSPNFSLTSLLGQVPADVSQVVWHNQEAVVERDDVVDPFTQVTLFKRNARTLPPHYFAKFSNEVMHNNRNYFLTYANGKAAARVQDHLRPNGAHRWASYYHPTGWKELQMTESVVLHYTYTRFTDLTSRKNRCGCLPTRKYVDACFFLEFDKAAFIIASTSTPEEMRSWYNEHVVWTDKGLNARLLEAGIFSRIHSQQLIVQGLVEAGAFSDLLEAGRRDIMMQ